MAPAPQTNTLPTGISYRQFNPGENLPMKVTFNNSTHKIETEKRKQEI